MYSGVSVLSVASFRASLSHVLLSMRRTLSSLVECVFRFVCDISILWLIEEAFWGTARAVSVTVAISSALHLNETNTLRIYHSTKVLSLYFAIKEVAELSIYHRFLFHFIFLRCSDFFLLVSAYIFFVNRSANTNLSALRKTINYFQCWMEIEAVP